jgi:hypothetical protein
MPTGPSRTAGVALEVLARLGGIAPDATAMDVGCGTGRVTEALLALVPRGRAPGPLGALATTARRQLGQSEDLPRRRTCGLPCDCWPTGPRWLLGALTGDQLEVGQAGQHPTQIGLRHRRRLRKRRRRHALRMRPQRSQDALGLIGGEQAKETPRPVLDGQIN